MRVLQQISGLTAGTLTAISIPIISDFDPFRLGVACTLYTVAIHNNMKILYYIKRSRGGLRGEMVIIRLTSVLYIHRGR